MTEVRREPGLRIGIIGVGRLGHLLALFLLRYGDVYPQELFLVSSNKFSSSTFLFDFQNFSQVDKLIF